MVWLGDLGSTLLGALYGNPIPVAILGLGVVIALGIVARRRAWDHAARRHPGRSLALGTVLAALVVPTGWYLASPLVLTASIDEPAPTTRGPATSGTSIAAGSGVPATSGSASAAPLSTRDPSPSPTPASPRDRTGLFHGSDDFHFGRGTARLIAVAPGQLVVRLEDFAVRNGPDLYVYLSPSRDGYAPGAIELGRLKADTGNQNYAVPAGAAGDAGRAASVVIWCKQFSHLFATAPLAD